MDLYCHGNLYLQTTFFTLYFLQIEIKRKLLVYQGNSSGGGCACSKLCIDDVDVYIARHVVSFFVWEH